MKQKFLINSHFLTFEETTKEEEENKDADDQHMRRYILGSPSLILILSLDHVN